MNVGTVPLCGFCGRPIGLLPMWLGGRPYHFECTQPPGKPSTFQPIAVTAEEVRQIVREELERAAGVEASQDDRCPNCDPTRFCTRKECNAAGVTRTEDETGGQQK